EFQMTGGRLIERLTQVRGVWQERFVSESNQLLEEFESQQADYDYGRRNLKTSRVQIARWQASGHRLEQKEQKKSPLMQAVADTITVHMGTPPRLQAEALKAKIYQN